MDMLKNMKGTTMDPITIYGTDYKTDEAFIAAATDAWNHHDEVKVQILHLTERQKNLMVKIIRSEI